MRSGGGDASLAMSALQGIDVAAARASTSGGFCIDRHGRDELRPFPSRICRLTSLERLPYTWNHVTEEESLKFKELERVLIEKVEQLFRDMLYAVTNFFWTYFKRSALDHDRFKMNRS